MGEGIEHGAVQGFNILSCEWEDLYAVFKMGSNEGFEHIGFPFQVDIRKEHA